MSRSVPPVTPASKKKRIALYIKTNIFSGIELWAIPVWQSRRSRSSMPKKPMSGDPGPDVSGARFADGLTNDLRVCFGSNFRLAREKAGLTQLDIQVRTGIKQHYVSQIESGRQNPTLGTLSVLAAAVGQNVSSMLRPRPKASRRDDPERT